MVTDLVILESSRNDTGSYQCEARSLPEDSEIGSASLRLNVLFNPGKEFPICFPDKEIRVRIGEQVSLSCMSENGNPQVDLMWYRQQDTNFDNVLPLQASTSNEGDFITSTLTLTTTLQDTNELFTCKIISEHLLVNETRSCAISVKVIWPSPAIAVFVYPSQQVVQVNSTAEFSCHTAFPPDREPNEDNHLEWTIPSQINSSLVVMSENRLTILNVGLEERILAISCLVIFDDRWFEDTSLVHVVTNYSNISDINSNITYNPWNITFPTQSPSSSPRPPTPTSRFPTPGFPTITSTLMTATVQKAGLSELDRFLGTPFCWVPSNGSSYSLLSLNYLIHSYRVLL